MTVATAIESERYHFIPGYKPHVIVCKFCRINVQVWLRPYRQGDKPRICDDCRSKRNPKKIWGAV